MSATDARSASKIRAWGLTGGVAAGKSTVAKLFEKEGLPVIDADEVSRDISAPGGPAHAEILKRFKTGHRAKLREIIFADPAAKRDLELLLHPLIQAESLRRMRLLADAFPGEAGRFVVIYEAALLVETGRYRDFEGLIVVSAPLAVRKQRMIERDQLSEALADKILTAQASDADRRRVATVVIENDSTREELSKKVRHIARRIQLIKT